MNKGNECISIFEHESLYCGRGEKQLSEKQLAALQAFYGERGQPYFTLLHKGVKFCEYVGLLQIGNLTLEILPKADKLSREEDSAKWRSKLIGMLRAVGLFEIHAPSSSHLQLKPNAILDLYFELFLTELEYLLHCGLIKQYKKTEGNTNALKGKLLFNKQIQQNLTHQERFYTQYSNYSVVHPIHQILYKALKLMARINNNIMLKSRIATLLLNFPEMPDIKVTEANFEQIAYDRKNEHYQKAIDIAKLLLLNYHPDIIRGEHHVLALMFDMNALWEKFVYISLRKGLENARVYGQVVKNFWKPESGYSTKMKPDILIEAADKKIVLDTKWKNLGGKNPSAEDLRQMYVYHEFFSAEKTALVYPDATGNTLSGKYYEKHNNNPTTMECSLIGLAVEDGTIADWQKNIVAQIRDWAQI